MIPIDDAVLLFGVKARVGGVEVIEGHLPAVSSSGPVWSWLKRASAYQTRCECHATAQTGDGAFIGNP